MTTIEEMIEKGYIAGNVNDIDLGKNSGIFVKIGIVSRTTSYLIVRNNEPTETTSEEFYGEERVVIPGNKWRGAERSYILSQMRSVDGAIPRNYERNAVVIKSVLRNPVSLIFGDSSTGTGKNATSIASRNYYDWAYSFQPVFKITERLTHNSLSDTGTILHETSGSVKSNAIYETQYIKPGCEFLRFVTMENISKEMLAIQLMAIIYTTRYGARTAILGDNVSNDIIGIGFSKGDKPISSYTVMKKCWETGNYEPDTDLISSMEEIYGENLISGKDLNSYIEEVRRVKASRDELKTISSVLVSKMESDWKDMFR